VTGAPSLYDVVDHTWPAAEKYDCGPFTLRKGMDGGSRVSAATANEPALDTDIARAEQVMRDMGQTPLFMVRPPDRDLDAQLAARGYEAFDAVNIYTCPVAHLTDIPIPRVTCFVIWEPLEIIREIWQSGGIGAARQAVMARAKGPKTALLLRHNDKPGGAGFCAIHLGVAMVHAVEILPHQRKQGLGKWLMRKAAFWAKEHGAKTLSVICTKENEGANALYRSLGMTLAGEYHYCRLHNGSVAS
jgi:GNAT superfamily N-acetyltransferase